MRVGEEGVGTVEFDQIWRAVIWIFRDSQFWRAVMTNS